MPRLLQVRAGKRVRSQWSETFRAAKADDPKITAERFLAKQLRRFKIGLARRIGGAGIARLLAEKPKAARTTGPPPARPPNVH